MGYLISLLIGVAIITGVFAGPFDFADALKSNALQIVAPTPRENALIADLRSHQEVLGEFIRNAAQVLPKNATAAQRENLLKAQEALITTEETLSNLQQQITEDTPGIITTLVKKVIGIESAEPTSIPPQCKLTCSN